LWGGQWQQIEPLLFQLVRGQLGNGETLVAFQEDRTGQIVRMFNGTWTHEKVPPETTEQTVTVNISPQILNAYVGQYEIAPNLLVTISLEDDKLMGVMTGQSKVELAPASETRFVVREANAEVNFVKDAQGQVTHLVLRLNGEEMRGRKIK
jgi:hypothetical protein